MFLDNDDNEYSDDKMILNCSISLKLHKPGLYQNHHGFETFSQNFIVVSSTFVKYLDQSCERSLLRQPRFCMKRKFADIFLAK